MLWIVAIVWGATLLAAVVVGLSDPKVRDEILKD